ncbi:MAG: ATP-binding protein [Pseudomonadota bacterium]|nr:ATP-binding protein [Pseudomonadota bacterium]
MTNNTSINDLISFLPMPAIIINAEGYIVNANVIYKEKFKFNRISNLNKVKIATFFTFDIENILRRLYSGDNSVSTYDYKLSDLDDNEIIVDLHFNKVSNDLVLLIIQEKDNFKTYMTQTSKTLSDLFIRGFSESLDRNLSSPVTNVLAAIELFKEKKILNNELDANKIIGLVEAEMSKVKNYINKTLNFHANNNSKAERINIHECLVEALESLDRKYFNTYKILKDFDPSIPNIYFNRNNIIRCFENLLFNACESKENNFITITTRINHDIYLRSSDLQKVVKLPIHIKISDEGIGISEDIEKFIFYPFVGTKNHADGLGLAYINAIISNSGGFIKLEKEKNITAFNIYLPLKNEGKVYNS